MALTAKEKTLKVVKDNGWVLDPYAYDHVRYSNKVIQHPHVFIKEASFGGIFQITLDYLNSDGWSRHYDDLLRRVSVVYYPDAQAFDTERRNDGKPVRVGALTMGTLKNSDRGRYGSTSWLWEALGRQADGEYFYSKSGKPRTLRDRAELLIGDVETALWVSWVLQNEHRIKENEAALRAEAHRQAAARPLPLTIPQPGKFEHGNEYYAEGGWYSLASKLDSAAGHVRNADGLSDLPQLLADVQLALEAVQGVLTDEAAQQMQAIVAEAHNQPPAREELEALLDV